MKDSKQQGNSMVAAFDFDGTLTTCDTLLAFIRFTHGRWPLMTGFLRYAPLLLLMKLRLYPNWKAKQKVFAHFYKGTTYRQFSQWGHDFAPVASNWLNNSTVDTLHRHLDEGHTVCVITASIDEWVRPICEQLGVSTLLATRIEVDNNGLITGHFLTPNCYGEQKVARLLKAFPDRKAYTLYAYGDSRGDRELLAFADKGIRINRNNRTTL